VSRDYSKVASQIDNLFSGQCYLFYYQRLPVAQAALTSAATNIHTNCSIVKTPSSAKSKSPPELNPAGFLIQKKRLWQIKHLWLFLGRC
jgi:hypothetical protein